ncbi:MAG: hypothetical protein ACPGJS_16875 [Flammeovirgaceae bacterium]
MKLIYTLVDGAFVALSEFAIPSQAWKTLSDEIAQEFFLDDVSADELVYMHENGQSVIFVEVESQTIVAHFGSKRIFSAQAIQWLIQNKSDVDFSILRKMFTAKTLWIAPQYRKKGISFFMRQQLLAMHIEANNLLIGQGASWFSIKHFLDLDCVFPNWNSLTALHALFWFDLSDFKNEALLQKNGVIVRNKILFAPAIKESAQIPLKDHWGNHCYLWISDLALAEKIDAFLKKAFGTLAHWKESIVLLNEYLLNSEEIMTGNVYSKEVQNSPTN